MKRRTTRLVARLVLLCLLAGLSAAAVAQQNTDPGAAPNDETKIEKISILRLLVKGGYFMIPIGLCSILAAVVVIERLIALQRSRIIPPGFVRQLQQVFQQGRNRNEAVQYCRQSISPMARVAEAGLRKLHRGEQAVEDAIEDAGANEVSKLRRNLRMLYGIAAVAPMLGLLGTVWGMIQAFQVASQQGLGGRATSLAGGIYEALVTTFAGLLVAIPVLIFYYYFLGKIERIVHEMNDQSVELIEGTLVLDTPPAPSPQPAKPAPAGPSTPPATA